jgi:hypothetical protein
MCRPEAKVSNDIKATEMLKVKYYMLISDCLRETFKILNEEPSCADKWEKISKRTQRHQRFGGYCEKRNSCNQASKDS